jgi:glycosyltransferase involved in cell wall biosynthesis
MSDMFIAPDPPEISPKEPEVETTKQRLRRRTILNARSKLYACRSYRSEDHFPARSTHNTAWSNKMRVVLLVLSGDPVKARDKLTSDYPHAQVELVSRGEIEGRGLTKRLRALRALKADVFAIATEKLQWQRGQQLFMLFGALAGAREVVMLDAQGAELKRSRASLLIASPLALSNEAIASAKTFAKARRELKRLEVEVVQNSLPANLRVTSSPRIVFLRSTPGPGTQAGGAASHIKGVVEGLVELGAHVDVVSNDRIAGFDDTKIPVTIIEPVTSGGTRAVFDIKNNLNFTRKLLPLIDRDAPDFIYQRYARFSWAGVVAALERKRPLFLEYNGSEVWVGRHWDRVGKLELLERYERLNLNAATRIFVVSEVERRNLERRGIESNKIVINPNGVDARVFRPGVGGAEVRRGLGLATEDVVVGFVGTFGPWHGVLVLAEAIKAIPVELPLRFVLVGSGSLHTQVEQMLRSEIEKGRVIFTGPVKHEEVPALLDACDILASPHVPLSDGSDFFGSPTKLFEYMAMGKGIVASRLGQIGEVLKHDESALLLEPGDAAALANAIQQMAQSKALRTRLGEKAREVVVSNYTWAHNAQRVINAYLSLDSES